MRIEYGKKKSTAHRGAAYVPLWKKLCAGLCATALVATTVPVAAVAATAPGAGGPGGTTSGGTSSGSANTQTYDYTGSYSGVLTADGTSVSSSNETYSTSTADQNVALAENGGTLTIDGDTFTKSGDDTDGDNCNFYGVNSSVLAVGDSSKIYISDTNSSSTSEGSNGYFATDGATIYANNDSITTTDGGNARGLDATYAGAIVANKMDISTEKDHCASIATDRGGGYISVTNSELSTAGSGSPLLYSTGDIEVDNVTGTATGSQIAGMEGLNTILINDSTLTSTSDARSGSDPIKDGVILYQSTSGDADTSTSSASDFEASDSTLKTSISSGAFFYVTNTTGNIVLSNTTLDYDSSNCELLHASGNSNNWGTTGSNGADVTLTGIGQTLSGDVYCDDESSVDLYLTDGSTWTGTVASSTSTGDGTTGASENVDVNIDTNSTWVVTGSCTIGSLDVASGGKVVDSSGNTVTIVNSSGTTLVSGTSSYTVTVSGTYSTSTVSGAGTLSGASSTLTSARSTFDSYYGTTTTWDANSSASTGSDTSSSDSSSSSSTSTTSSSNSSASTSKKKAKTFTINTKTVTAKKLKAAAKKAGATTSSATSVTLGSKVKTIKKGAFKAFKKLKTVKVKTKKLTKKRVKGSLKGSKVKTIKVKVSKKKAMNKKYVKKYKKIFTKKNCGKKVKVKVA